MTDKIDDFLLVIESPKKISVENIEGTSYELPRAVYTDRASLGQVTVAAGLTSNGTVTFHTGPVVLIPQLLFSLYLNNDGDSTYLWPAGSNLTSANRPRVTWGMNEVLTDPRNGKYVWSFSIKNETAGSQDFYLHVRVLLPDAYNSGGAA